MAKFMKIEDWADTVGYTWEYIGKGKLTIALFRDGILCGHLPVKNGYIKLGTQ